MTTANWNAVWVRWLARILSIGSFLFIGAFVVGEITNGDGQMPRTDEWPGLLFFPVGLLTGLGLAWKKELAGGLVAVLSIGAFYVWNFARAGTWPTGPWFLLLATPGVMFIIASLLRNSRDDPDESTPQRSDGARTSKEQHEPAH